jgi:hypothetical protein
LQKYTKLYYSPISSVKKTTSELLNKITINNGG